MTTKLNYIIAGIIVIILTYIIIKDRNEIIETKIWYKMQEKKNWNYIIGKDI